MITDNIENINLYDKIPQYAKEFIKNLSNNPKLGRYEIKGKDYANIESYNTKLPSEAKFESHKNYIDIQLLLRGQERIYLNNIKSLETDIPYNKEKDIEFYKENVSESDFVTLNGRNFAMIYPHEAHAPQVSISDKSDNVLKVVIKIHV